MSGGMRLGTALAVKCLFRSLPLKFQEIKFPSTFAFTHQKDLREEKDYFVEISAQFSFLGLLVWKKLLRAHCVIFREWNWILDLQGL